MPSTATRPARHYPAVRYNDLLTLQWLWAGAPCRWRGNVTVRFTEVPFSRLQRAGSLTHYDVLDRWRTRLRMQQPVPPLVVCATGQGSFYIHDGNHRYAALAEYFGDTASHARVRVALVVPRSGHFQYRWFGTYGTYVLVRVSQQGEAKPRSPAAAPSTGGLVTPLMTAAGISGPLQ